MMENMNQSMSRGDKIEVISQRSDSLVHTSQSYKTTAHRVKVQQRNRRYMMIAGAIGLTLLLVLIIMFGICGITFSKCTGN